MSYKMPSPAKLALMIKCLSKHDFEHIKANYEQEVTKRNQLDQQKVSNTSDKN